MQHEQILESIRQFIIEQTNLEDASFLEQDTNLFEAGLLDSLLTVSLVAFFESAFGCELDAEDMTEENFGTLSAMTQLIRRKLAPGQT